MCSVVHRYRQTEAGGCEASGGGRRPMAQPAGLPDPELEAMWREAEPRAEAVAEAMADPVTLGDIEQWQHVPEEAGGGGGQGAAGIGELASWAITNLNEIFFAGHDDFADLDLGNLGNLEWGPDNELIDLGSPVNMPSSLYTHHGLNVSREILRENIFPELAEGRTIPISYTGCCEVPVNRHVTWMERGSDLRRAMRAALSR